MKNFWKISLGLLSLCICMGCSAGNINTAPNGGENNYSAESLNDSGTSQNIYNAGGESSTAAPNSTGENTIVEVSSKSRDKNVIADDGKVVLKYSINYPVISNQKNSAGISAINDYYKKTAEDFFNEENADYIQQSEQAKEYYEQWKKAPYEGSEFYPFEMVKDFEVTYNDNSLLSIKHIYTTYFGGAHPSHIISSEIFDVKTGKELQDYEIAHISKEEMDNKVVMCTKQMIAENPQGFFEEDMMGPLDLKGQDRPEYYLTKEGLVYYFQIYAIAPYAAGNPEFVIPLDNAEK